MRDAGILAATHATTTWWLAPLFRQRYPDVVLEDSHMRLRFDAQDRDTFCVAKHLFDAGVVVHEVLLPVSHPGYLLLRKFEDIKMNSAEYPTSRGRFCRVSSNNSSRNVMKRTFAAVLLLVAATTLSAQDRHRYAVALRGPVLAHRAPQFLSVDMPARSEVRARLISWRTAG